jgi:hypothetical protein
LMFDAQLRLSGITARPPQPLPQGGVLETRN